MGRRTTIMTIGFVLIFIGIQLNLVQTYVLTPRVSNFLSEQARSYSDPGYQNVAQANTPYNSPYYQASYGTPANAGNNPVQPIMQPAVTSGFTTPRTITPPSWLSWPILFLGAVVFLNGLSMRRNYS